MSAHSENTTLTQEIAAKTEQIAIESTRGAEDAAEKVGAITSATIDSVFQTLHFEQLPAWMQTDPHIQRGYRKSTGAINDCLHSLWYPHNELVNTWSHLLPATFFLALLVGADYLQLKDLKGRNGGMKWSDLAMMQFYFACTALCLLFSATFHGMNSHSFEMARRTLKLDYLGIVLTISSTCITSTYFGLYGNPRLQAMYISVTVLCGTTVFWMVLRPDADGPKAAAWRAAVFTTLGASGFGAIVHAGLKGGVEALKMFPLLNIAVTCSCYLLGRQPSTLPYLGGYWADCVPLRTERCPPATLLAKQADCILYPKCCCVQMLTKIFRAQHLIDFAPFLSSDPVKKKETAQAVLEGFQGAGFIYLKNHGIPEATVSDVFANSAKFFARPQAQKDALSWYSPEANRGYSAAGREKVTDLEELDDVGKLREAVPDLKESLEIGREGEEGMPNMWPAVEGDNDAKVFKEVMLKFHDTCKALHMQLMRAIALGMGIDEQWFDSFTDRGDNTLRLLHYPGVPKSVFKRQDGQLQVRAGEHSDYGSATLLFQDSRGGLQVRSPKGTFVNATPIPGAIVVNAGDLLARWSNDTIKSTKHRVVEPPPKKDDGDGSDSYPPRYSVAYFCNPNFDRTIEAIPGTYEKTGKKYPAVTSGEYLVKRLTSTY
ncbi:unnamed protein product [Periconia digitata]|uniref:Fe2OG dioxygenase domain-containing protein n=1 Tax=Periconia digitata TaxID=1303443 RepID=A0A9W4UA36_9PLEO|nr:unnamed protein product [Periconia digitata]